MKAMIYLMFSACFTIAAGKAIGVDKAAVESISSGVATLRDIQTTSFTYNGGAIVQHCMFSDTLTVYGSADVHHSKIKFGIIHGGLKAHGIDAHSLIVSGGASVSGKSDISEAHVNGFLSIDNSYVDLATVNGSVYGKEAYIKKITVNDGNLHFIDSDLGKIFVNNSDAARKTVMIQLLGKTTVRHLSITSKATPAAIIILDDESQKTFNKSVVTSSGKVEYK